MDLAHTTSRFEGRFVSPTTLGPRSPTRPSPRARVPVAFSMKEGGVVNWGWWCGVRVRGRREVVQSCLPREAGSHVSLGGPLLVESREAAPLADQLLRIPIGDAKVTRGAGEDAGPVPFRRSDEGCWRRVGLPQSPTRSSPLNVAPGHPNDSDPRAMRSSPRLEGGRWLAAMDFGARMGASSRSAVPSRAFRSS
jgi:hypothetical protein